MMMKVRACSICGSDLKIYRHGHRLIVPPQTIGHEFAGEIVEIGQENQDWKIGDRITVVTSVPCLNCEACRRGYLNICDNLGGVGYTYAGGFAEYIRIPSSVLRAGNLIPLPDALSYVHACISEPLACVINAQELSRVAAGDTVTVIGTGPMGCMHLALAKARGAAKTIGIDISDVRLALAKTAGADVCINSSETKVKERVLEETDGWGSDVVVVSASALEAAWSALDLVAKRGRLDLFAGVPIPSPQLPIDLNRIHYDEIFINGSTGSTRRQQANALALLTSGQVDPTKLITHIIDFARFSDALEVAMSGSALKVVMVQS
jgi:L-iditol 2-dehydrogenase